MKPKTKLAVRTVSLFLFIFSFITCSSTAGRKSMRPTQAPGSFVPESLYIPMPNLVPLSTYNVSEPAQSGSVVNVDSFGAVGDGTTDDTTAISNAIASLSSGGTVVFTPGKVYRKTALITVTPANITLWGYGAVIYADTNGAPLPDLAIKLVGSGDNAFGMTILSNLAARVSNNTSAALLLVGDNQSVIDARIEYTGVCIWAQGTHFFVGRNVCYRDWADGLTSAAGGACNNFPPNCYVDHGIIAGNVVRQNGDDMISIVNYADTDDQAPFISDILVEYNDLADSYGGAGVAVHGGKNITIRHNRIGPDPCISGIQVDSQVAFLLRNVSNILVNNNDISDVQTTSPPYNPHITCPTPGGVNHGAIYVNVSGGGGAGHHLDSVLIINNNVTRALRKGVQLQEQGTPVGVATNVGIQGLRLSGVQDTSINVPASTTVCSDNQVVDDSTIVATNCTSGAMPSVTGSSYTSR